MEIGGRICREKVETLKETKNKLTVAQRFTDYVAKAMRSWTFIICQMIFITIWMIFNHEWPQIAFDDKAFDILRLALTIEGSFIGSILLMNQYRQSVLDRKVTYTDFIIDCQIQKELKRITPMIERLYRDMEQRKK
ncbi:MAG TPA: DUF1003 domain-containing protein [Candidatus Saccharimonadales bacterium]